MNVSEAFAVVREAARRKLGMRHFDVQVSLYHSLASVLFCFVFLIAKMLVVNLLREEEYVSISNRDYDNLIVLLKVFITISIVKSALLVIEKPNRLYSMHV